MQTANKPSTWPWWLFAVFAIPLLVPYRWLPITSFHQDCAAYLIAAVAAGYVAWKRLKTDSNRIEFALVSWIPILFAGVLVVQQLLGRIIYLQHFVLAFFALLIAGLGANVAYHTCRYQLPRAVALVAKALVLVGLIQCAWTLVQLAGFELKGWDLIVRAPGPYRVGGLIAQPNQLSVLLMWGLLSLFYLWLRGHMGTAFAGVVAACFLITLSLSASRATYVYFFLVAPALSLVLFRIGHRRAWWLPVCAAISYPAISYAVRAAVYAFDPAASVEVVRPLEGASTAARLAFIKDGWQLFLSSPILGAGWSQFISARWAMGDATLIELHADHAHNIVVNLLAETGLIGFGIVVGGFALWLRRVASVELTVERTLVLAMLLVVALYSLFEFPLWLGHFLIPTAVLCGLLETRHVCYGVSRGFSRLTTASVALLPVLVVLTALDYWRVESLYRAFFRDGNSEVPKLEALLELTNKSLYRQQAEQIYLLAAPIDSFQATFNAQMSERVFVGFPAPQFAVVRAAHLLYNKEVDQAVYVLRRTCRWIESSCLEMRRRFEWLASHNGEPFVTFAANHLDGALPSQERLPADASPPLGVDPGDRGGKFALPNLIDTPPGSVLRE
jgi:O-antigen ligase